MDKDYIKIEDLKEGYTYRILARNARYGIWVPKTSGFLISRIKFGDNFLFEEYHWDCESYATVKPIREVERSPFTIEDDMYKQEAKILTYLNNFENINRKR